LGEGYAGRVALNRKSVHIQDLRDSPQDAIHVPFIIDEGFIAYYAVPLIAKGSVLGVLEVFHRELLVSNGEWLSFLETLAGQAAIAIDNAELFSKLERSNVDLLRAYDATIEGWAHALDLKDEETEDHSQRVTELTLRIASKMSIKDEDLAHVRRGALLHDIGKMGIPDSILLKPGKLTDDEWEIMRKHPVYAFEMLSSIDYLRPALDIPYCHHERWDGSGYPRGLKGKQIPLEARIFAVVDVFDALTNDRPYRKAWARETALEYIREQSGKHFDPQVLSVFMHEVGDLVL
jgi:putative nucleotidyltransferase with HDIG domain